MGRRKPAFVLWRVHGGPHSCYLPEHAKRGRGHICALCKTWSFGGCVWPSRQEREERVDQQAGLLSYLHLSGCPRACQLLPTLGVVHAWQPAPPVSADGEASLPEQPTLPSLPSGIEKRLETVQPKVSKTCFGVYLCLVGMPTGIEALTFSVVSK